MVSSLNKYDVEILKFLYKADKPVYQNEIPTLINLDSKAVSKSLYKLEKLKLVSREPVVHNKRRTYIVKVDKEKVLEVLESIGELPLTLSEAVASIINIPCIKCPYVKRCYEGGFYDPTRCQLLIKFVKENSNSTQ